MSDRIWSRTKCSMVYLVWDIICHILRNVGTTLKSKQIRVSYIGQGLMSDTLFLNECINIFQLSCILMYMHEKPLVAFLSLARLKTFLPKRPEMDNPNLVNMCPNTIGSTK